MNKRVLINIKHQRKNPGTGTDFKFTKKSEVHWHLNPGAGDFNFFLHLNSILAVFSQCFLKMPHFQIQKGGVEKKIYSMYTFCSKNEDVG